MDRMNGRKMTVVLIFLLFLVTFTAGFALFHTYKNSYRKYNLLRIDPLEIAGDSEDATKTLLLNSEIWMLGDSRVKRWPDGMLGDSPGIANLGMEGQTSGQVLFRFKSYLETATPSLVILEVGINDLKIIGIDADLAEPVTRQYYRNIEQMIQLCRVLNIRMILINIFPAGKIEFPRRLVWNSTAAKAISEANLRLGSYCDDDATYCLDANAILSDNGKIVRPEYQDDFLHINTRGYEALSSRLQELINKVNNQN